MLLTTLTLLSTVPALLLLTAAIKKDKNLAMASAAGFILVSSTILVSGINVTEGYTKNTYTNDTVIENTNFSERYNASKDKVQVRIPHKVSLESSTGIKKASVFFGLIYLAIGLALAILAALPKKYGKSSLSKLLS